MSSSTEPLWDEMLEEFRALGGTAENVCLRQGRYGRGLFPADASKPVQIRIPDSLLVDHKYAEFPGGTFRLAAETPVGSRERAFLENYERDFSWPAGKREIEGIFEIMQEGSPELRELLQKSYYGFRWTAEPTDRMVQQRFIDSRVINYKGANVIMPIVELANHGHATRYQTKDGVGLGGTFADEVLVRYQLCDPLQIFGKWGFASDSEFIALSVHIAQHNTGLFVGRGDPKPDTESKPFLPAMTREGGQIRLAYLLLGNRRQPGLPRANFLHLMREAGRNDADDMFEAILHVNRMHMLQLIAACEGAPPRLGRLLRSMARAQLEIMSFCIGRAG